MVLFGANNLVWQVARLEDRRAGDCLCVFGAINVWFTATIYLHLFIVYAYRHFMLCSICFLKVAECSARTDAEKGQAGFLLLVPAADKV